MNSSDRDDEFFVELAARSDEPGPLGAHAPSRLKSRIYSALVRRQERTGPLLSLTETKASGRPLCVFEDLLQIAPVGERIRSFNACSICHARVLAESFESPPIFWPHCPYVQFKKS